MQIRPPFAPPTAPTSFAAPPAAPGEAALPELAESPFVKLLTEQVQEVNQMQHAADGAVHELLTGGNVSQAEVMTSVQKADMAFRMLVQIRNKLMDAYHEVNRIQV